MDVSPTKITKTVAVTIHTARPGIVIGKGGEEVNRLKDEIRQLTERNVQVNISEEKVVFLTTGEEKVVFLTTDEEKSRVFDDG